MDGLENKTATNAEETLEVEKKVGADGTVVTTPEAGTGNDNQGGNGDGGDNTGTQTGTDSKEADPEAKKAFDEVLKKDKALQAEYDRRVAKATTQIRFEACLQRTLEKAGVKDTIDYLAHIDVDDLKAHYDAKKDTIEGYETVEEEMRKSYPHYFENGTATGGAHGTFEKNNNATLSL